MLNEKDDRGGQRGRGGVGGRGGISGPGIQKDKMRREEMRRKRMNNVSYNVSGEGGGDVEII